MYLPRILAASRNAARAHKANAQLLARAAVKPAAFKGMCFDQQFLIPFSNLSLTCNVTARSYATEAASVGKIR